MGKQVTIMWAVSIIKSEIIAVESEDSQPHWLVTKPQINLSSEL